MQVQADPYAEEPSGATAIDQAAAMIRDALVNGHFTPGERLKVAELARAFSLGAMPVREALRQLEGEGLVEIMPNRGAIARAVDQRMLVDLYEVRLTLELLAVGRAIERMTLEKLSRLEAIAARHEAAAGADNIIEAVGANRDLHITLFEIAGNAHATRLFARDWQLVYALRRHYGYAPGRLKRVGEEHRLLLAAIGRGDRAGAEAIMRMHNQAGLEDVLAHCDVG